MPSLRIADAFPVVASLPPKNRTLFFGGREATTGNASAVRRLILAWGKEISFVPGEHGFSSFQAENVHWKCMGAAH